MRKIRQHVFSSSVRFKLIKTFHNTIWQEIKTSVRRYQSVIIYLISGKKSYARSYGKGGRKPIPYTNVILFLDLTLSSPDRDLSTKLITHPTLGLAENT